MKNLLNYLGVFLLFGLLTFAPALVADDIGDVGIELSVSDVLVDAEIDVDAVSITSIPLTDQNIIYIAVVESKQSVKSIDLEQCDDLLSRVDIHKFSNHYRYLNKLEERSKINYNWLVFGGIRDPGRFYFGSQLLQLT